MLLNAHTFYYAGKYDQALEQSGKTQELFPNYHLISLGPIYEQKGMQDEAIDSYLQTEERWGLPAASVTKLRQAYATSGWQGYWRKRLDLLNANAKQESVPPLFPAEIYSRLGDKDKAFEFLQRAYEVRQMTLMFIKVGPVWTSLRPIPGSLPCCNACISISKSGIVYGVNCSSLQLRYSWHVFMLKQESRVNVKHIRNSPVARGHPDGRTSG